MLSTSNIQEYCAIYYAHMAIYFSTMRKQNYLCWYKNKLYLSYFMIYYIYLKSSNKICNFILQTSPFSRPRPPWQSNVHNSLKSKLAKIWVPMQWHEPQILESQRMLSQNMGWYKVWHVMKGQTHLDLNTTIFSFHLYKEFLV